MEAWLASLADELAANRGPQDYPGSVSFLPYRFRTRRTSCRSQWPRTIRFWRGTNVSSSGAHRLRLKPGVWRQFGSADRRLRGNWRIFVALLPTQARYIQKCRSHYGDVRTGDVSRWRARFARPIVDCYDDRRYECSFARAENSARKSVASCAERRNPGLRETFVFDRSHAAHCSQPHVRLVRVL